MTTTPTAAAQVAVRLHDALQVVRGLDHFITSGNRVSVDVGAGDDPVEVQVHACTPAQMDRAVLQFPNASASRDADDILKWVECPIGECSLTFYRR